jgi:hypothetical protein
MALSTQQQRERTTAPSTVTAPMESSLAAFWREVITENPVYQREAHAIQVPASYSPEKAEAHRAKLCAAQAKWEALPTPQKAWRRTRPYLVLFGLAYALIPLVLPWLTRGGGGGLIGPLISGLFISTALTGASIVGEREKRTWNALLLSRLTPAQILGGKVANVLRVSLFALTGLLTMGLALVARGVVSPAVLLLLPLVLLPNALLSVLVGVEISLWSKNLKEAASKNMWRLGGLNFLAFLLCLLTVVVLFGHLPPALWIVPVLYCLICVHAARRVWQRMLRSLWDAPKDFSG